MSESKFSFRGKAPRNILLIKGASAGVGDLLRSSAAWRALRNRFPESRLHLLFLTRDPGSPSEELIGRHHLLSSFSVTDKRTRKLAGWKKLLGDARKVAKLTQPDMVVDFEMNGVRTSLLSLYLKFWSRAWTVGVAEAPGRGWFYDRAAPSRKVYARRHGMQPRLEYTELDFVVLGALGIERQGTAVELRETDEGRAFRARLIRELGQQGAHPVLGVNIGCGPPTIGKRPNLDKLAALVGELQRRYGFALVLTGAAHEREFNRDFLARFPPAGPVVDLAGRTTMLELAGAISACRLFISSDSGPYHMAVGLRVPTLALFNWDNWQHYHHHDWIECVVFKADQGLANALERAERLMRLTPPALPDLPR